MSKARRGKGIYDLFNRGRGTCPVCGTTAIKLLYEQDVEGQKIKVCKSCKAAIKHGKKSISTTAAETAASE